MQSTAASPTTKRPQPTSIELEPDVRQYLERRCKEEGRTLKWLINNAVRREMMVDEALKEQPDLFMKKRS